MNDLIDRQAAIDLFPNDALEWDTNCGYIAPHFARRMIEELPSTQPEIIRCKDCALWNDADSEHLVGYCTEGDYEKITFRNEWCCWAERKEE